ncbi:hypothetical protein GCM10010357_44900 [Streptomyces luteireticuli]|uniref:Ig-like domain-containing protein n=2 Tax=Streptomyces luteireticuli TaxID=173858 RepID=A0ABN0YYN3_9ACTN
MRALKTMRTARASATALLLAVAFPLAGPATTAHAVTVDVLCKGTEDGTYTPGLTLEPQLVHFRGEQHMSCTSTDPTLTSRTEIFEGDFVMSCLTPLFTGPVTLTFHWNNGRTSTADGKYIADSTGGNVLSVFRGKVTAGEFLGDAVETVLDDTQRNMQQCLRPEGLTHETGPYSVSFQRL